jgi:small subunit ribosomal protein S4
MGRYVGPACRVCRREGMKLFFKGQRCYAAKCPIETGRPAPGMHGASRRRKPSDYGTQLREKQRLRTSYGLREKQFRLFFQRAVKRRGITGEVLLQMLELRLDNVAYRLGLAASRRAARQFVRHNHVLVNGRKANVPSMILKPGDEVTVKDKPNLREAVKQNWEIVEGRGIVPWVALDKKSFCGRIVSVPTREEIAPTVNEQLIVELYSK